MRRALSEPTVATIRKRHLCVVPGADAVPKRRRLGRTELSGNVGSAIRYRSRRAAVSRYRIPGMRWTPSKAPLSAMP